MRIVERPSPNHGPRRPDAAIDMLVLHYTGMTSAAAAIERLRDPRAEVSAHYLVDEHGLVYRLVPEERRAWHAGVAYWAGERDVNDRSIGIELANPGHDLGYCDFPAPQMEALIDLSRGILGRHAIPLQRVLGHSDVAPARKIDPGEKFDWRALARAGIGLWPDGIDLGRAGVGTDAAIAPTAPVRTPASASIDIGAVQRALAAFGYEIAVSGVEDDQTATVVRAFQRHFRPTRVDGVADGDTVGVLARLTATVRSAVA